MIKIEKVSEIPSSQQYVRKQSPIIAEIKEAMLNMTVGEVIKIPLKEICGESAGFECSRYKGYAYSAVKQVRMTKPFNYDVKQRDSEIYIRRLLDTKTREVMP